MKKIPEYDRRNLEFICRNTFSALLVYINTAFMLAAAGILLTLETFIGGRLWVLESSA